MVCGARICDMLVTLRTAVQTDDAWLEQTFFQSYNLPLRVATTFGHYSRTVNSDDHEPKSGQFLLSAIKNTTDLTALLTGCTETLVERFGV